jgi:hypothetical protein
MHATLARWFERASCAPPRTVLTAGTAAAAALLATFTLIVADAAEDGPKRYARSELPVPDAARRLR